MDSGVLPRGLIVSCQAHGDHPLRDSAILSALAVCAARGGAVGIRADAPQDIQKIREKVSLPIIGIYKVLLSGERFFITPTLEHARHIVAAGANIVALEATFDNRPDERALADLIHQIHHQLQVPVMADISTLEEGLRAWKLGADFVGTTLSGYSSLSPRRETPDLALTKQLADVGVCVIAEGHVRTPQQASELFHSGAYGVVVGTAITDPLAITSWFVAAMQGQ
ncbi:MAG TPA: N-acetylmannosamine-6-phosphate 2-epimerase [Ktedonobacteraceae bacterium]|nr:N-acetylmannosamine-6-phosphate 2-epimerase [Ktedonobacteraceae bacterium]